MITNEWINAATCMADKKRDILEFVEQMNFEQMIPTQNKRKHF
jgi:hypothetical protein